MVTPQEFNEAWRALKKRELLELDVTDHALMIGWNPDGTDDDEHEIFSGILPSSLAHRFLKAAWDFGELWYVLTINKMVIGFQTPFGYSFLTPNSYRAASMPKDWRELHRLGTETLLALINETGEDGNHA